RRCWYMVDPAEGDDGSCPICGATEDDFLPPERRRKLFARLSTYSHIVARLQWDPTAIDFAPDVRAWPELPAARRRRLTTLLAGVREGVRRVDLDERWHIGFGLRCLIDAQPSPELIHELLARAEDAATAWGDAVPPAAREHATRMCARRLAIAGLMGARAAA